MDVRIEISTRDVVFAFWDRVALGLWRGKTSVGAMQRAGQLLTQYVAERQSPVLLLTVVEENAPLPSLEARVELVSFLKASNGLVERHGLVFEGEGFRAASIRAVVGGVSLFSRPDYPYRVFGSVGSAARFLAAGKNGSPAPHRVLRMVSEARRDRGSPTIVPWLTPQPQASSSLPPR
ncbi:MAG TPA: hypothetical protein VJU61_08670 [Polyangiaceae bacterium]|nr:hypothetical protein [Polyangiaceae bacterium]